jgi:hypothetical protein
LKPWSTALAERVRPLVRSIHERKGTGMLLGYPFLDVVWTMFIFFAWVIWIWLLILVLGDNFRRRDHSGWAKAGWTLLVIFLPLIGVLAYMITRPPEDLRTAPMGT